MEDEKYYYKLYICKICDGSTKSKSEFKKHFKKVHKSDLSDNKNEKKKAKSKSIPEGTEAETSLSSSSKPFFEGLSPLCIPKVENLEKVPKTLPAETNGSKQETLQNMTSQLKLLKIEETIENASIQSDQPLSKLDILVEAALASASANSLQSDQNLSQKILEEKKRPSTEKEIVEELGESLNSIYVDPLSQFNDSFTEIETDSIKIENEDLKNTNNFKNDDDYDIPPPILYPIVSYKNDSEETDTNSKEENSYSNNEIKQEIDETEVQEGEHWPESNSEEKEKTNKNDYKGECSSFAYKDANDKNIENRKTLKAKKFAKSKSDCDNKKCSTTSNENKSDSSPISSNEKNKPQYVFKARSYLKKEFNATPSSPNTSIKEEEEEDKPELDKNSNNILNETPSPSSKSSIKRKIPKEFVENIVISVSPPNIKENENLNEVSKPSKKTSQKIQNNESLQKTEIFKIENDEIEITHVNLMDPAMPVLFSECIIGPIPISNLERQSKKGPEKKHKWKCSLCNFSAKKKSIVSFHGRSHLGSHPYMCNICGISFSLKGNLKRHYSVHTGEKKYKCPYPTCDYRANDSSKIERHMPRHTGIRDLRYDCNFCSKKFPDKSGLKLHQRIHTGEKPYQCSFCGKKFSLRGNMRQHEQTHTKKEN